MTGRRIKADHSLILKHGVHNFSERYSLDVSDSLYAQEPELLRVLSTPTRANGNNIRKQRRDKFPRAKSLRCSGLCWLCHTFMITNRVAPSFRRLDRLEPSVTLNTRWQITSQTTGILAVNYRCGLYQQRPALGPVCYSGLALPSLRDAYYHSVTWAPSTAFPAI